ncbi:hypothetical protein PHYBLDRAFT_164809 [Phycomyces blakesleeanus NRRL 1555(-)]|uniref:Uncharacterized protein n=1 Tax=Phycomyces blakesleeanus (strain ATCC 8743b / DSM 1359 / FGSC 10004 / NBRC 33097 / NRRL 1555) TaxID=763407 RepID=A0A167PHL7_PHYB8|nr:hypothetical protein PHYBLDRAFT_164809 [Phycomyces blakesleeanus NRRL 1555(-)]OAD77929.1 hypothetical protein PHYBLDRAFT_164809 [Phycomyces blakesleeanus NRRL 1555(-)]|eukprot:XP_018295969.1 hypothetical protein PHYBLDRAFT_164809 [Phycomyces blakesleeanus NRRL 1555(-)]
MPRCEPQFRTRSLTPTFRILSRNLTYYQRVMCTIEYFTQCCPLDQNYEAGIIGYYEANRTMYGRIIYKTITTSGGMITTSDTKDTFTHNCLDNLLSLTFSCDKYFIQEKGHCQWQKDRNLWNFESQKLKDEDLEVALQFDYVYPLHKSLVNSLNGKHHYGKKSGLFGGLLGGILGGLLGGSFGKTSKKTIPIFGNIIRSPLTDGC